MLCGFARGPLPLHTLPIPLQAATDMFKPPPPPGPIPYDEVELTTITAVPVPLQAAMVNPMNGLMNGNSGVGLNNNYHNVDIDDPERTLYKGYWPARGICCYQGTSLSEVEFGELTDTTGDDDKKAFKIEITDTDAIYSTRVKLLPCACCFGGCVQKNTKTSALDGLTNIIVREDAACSGCCGMFLM